jgi:hypothetical protein
MSKDLKENNIVEDVVEDVVENIADNVVENVVENVVDENNKIKKRLDDFLNKNKSEIIDNYLSYTKIGVGIGFGVFTSIMLSRYFFNNKV